ncbi:M1 family metallopeptidase [Galbibacter sp. EGI 63066]|uniref:M1 family metallopeptidase n=1 Tax=Galbibacter sp. EGI 63066 TaxID=2993559 RepID=UPI0022497CF1|nr:M1 family metallopeptidase [Galbibacter sp. EGI 63066]MCX2682009.1 M1 family metallopeptidase [Galbibacter sp. EGI 63066]
MKHVFFYIFLFFSSAILAQQTTFVDFKKGEVAISVHPESKSVRGSITYTFDVLQSTDSIVIDAKNMTISSVFINEKSADYEYDGKKIYLNENFNKSNLNILKISYLCNPKQALYFIEDDKNDLILNRFDAPRGGRQIWTQGQGKYTSNWLPSFDDMNEKVEFDLSITAPSTFKVIANGKLLKKDSGDEQQTWHFDMQNPMSSYLLAFVVGNYDVKEELSESGIPMELYFYPPPADTAMVEPTYRYTKRIFDFLEDEIGVPFPWQNYKQVPVKDFLYSGMENTSLTIFSDAYVVDSTGFTDKNYVSVNAHELAHQWFGDLITEQSGTHHWLQEGFATYYALLAEEEVFGNDHYYLQLYQSAKQLDMMSQNEGEGLMNPKASSLTFYQRGAWVLHALRDKVGGKAFQLAVRNYLNAFAFKNVVTDDFIKIVETESGQDLDDFVQRWLVNKEFPIEKARTLLQKNKLTKTLLQFDTADQSELTDFVAENDSIFSGKDNYALVENVLRRLQTDSVGIKIYKKALQSDVLKTRQAAVLYIDSIPQQLKPDVEKLLNDSSYITVENTLLKLWIYFPEDRIKYLDTTKGKSGFNNKNIRVLWLALAVITPGYDNNNKVSYYEELINYTHPNYNFELRQLAFQYLYEVRAFNEKALCHLIQACHHHTWQFSKFSRELLDSLIAQEDYKKVLQNMLNKLNENEQDFLKEKLKTKE